MRTQLHEIPLREALHFLCWHGEPLEAALRTQIEALCREVETQVQPHVEMRRFALSPEGALMGTSFVPRGQDVCTMLSGCREAVLLAATLGAQSERMLLRAQACTGTEAVLLDAVLSAGIEAVCDDTEHTLRSQLHAQGLYLTDRFSPGYGDMPLSQSREICEVLSVQRTIGLTVSHSGIMIPRKSVTAIMGISEKPTALRPSGCAVCAARENCPLRRRENA